MICDGVGGGPRVHRARASPTFKYALGLKEGPKSPKPITGRQILEYSPEIRKFHKPTPPARVVARVEWPDKGRR